MKPYASTLLLSLAAAGHLFGQSGPSRLPLSGADDSLPVNANSGIVMAVPAEPSVRVIHVATTGDDVYDGLTWQTAKRTVTAGLSAAVSGDQVWVAKGAYLERVTLKAGVALYGGLVGSENSLSQRPAFPRAMSPDPNETTLDGNQAGSVVASSGATAATRMDGFTIRNGKADSGGGIYCDYNSSPTIVNNTITGNTATSDGGGISCYYSSPTIANNTIKGNSASKDGGGISCTCSDATIVNNRITGNSASKGGGVSCNSSSPTIVNNTITGNAATSDGGGIYCTSSSPMIVNNTITGNSAASGGGIYCYYCFSKIANNTISGNGATSSGGGISCYYKSSPTIVNNTIIANSASSGGGLSCSFSSPTIANTIIAFNSSGVLTGTGIPTLRYNCVYGNAGYNYSGAPDPTGTNGNSSVDPEVTGWQYGKWHLRSTSPCVGAGENASVPVDTRDLDGDGNITERLPFDLDGQPRIQPQDGRVDIGADESNGTDPQEGPNIIVRVSPEGDDSRDGSSWAKSKRTVQAGIDLARSLGGEVWVQAATYAERITLPSFVYVYGGFAGTENLLGERPAFPRTGPEYETTLDGQAGGSVVTAWAAGHGICGIDGFSIRNGNASSGGGMCCSYSSPTISNNTITGNKATSYYGGGIYCSYSSPTISNNTITGNSASSSGGGIFCYNSSSPTISNNTITGNNAGSSRGGGIYCADSSAPTILNNTVAQNSASSGGGIWCPSSSAISNNTIVGNTAYSGDGGGMLCGSSSTISNNTIIGNTASSGNGGGMVCGFSSAISNNTIVGNTAASGHGGGIVCGSASMILNSTIIGNRASQGGAIYCSSSSASAVIANNLMTGNSATSGGGIYCYSSSPAIVNNTMTGNSAPSGGGLYCDASSSPTVANTIIAFNSSGVFRTGTGTPTLRYNCVYGNAGSDYSGLPDPTGTNGNIAIDPEVAGWKYGNWHLRSTSPCVGAGENVSVPVDTRDLDGDGNITERLPFDLDGQPRIQPQDGTVDIGADESDGTDPAEGPNMIVRVSPEGDDSSDGSSWAAAKRTAQAAIDLAGSLGGEVWVKAGTYSERITLPAFVHVYGGFSGTENLLSERPAFPGTHSDYETTLDGQAGGSVVTVRSPGYGICVIDDFTIRNGKATSGGGIYCSSSSPTISNNRITGNTATSYHGGGVYCYYNSSPMIANTTITGNSASNGGGISCYYSSPTVVNTTITGNSATSYGGGIYCSFSSPTISNNTITGNTAGSYGGGIFCSASSPTIANTIIAFNSSGVFKTGPGTVTVRYSCVYGNTGYNYSFVPDPTGTNGNISVDPLFVRPAGPGPDGTWATADDDYGDLRLLVGSPCIDAGRNAEIPFDDADLDGDGNTTEPLPFDLASENRFFNDPATDDCQWMDASSSCGTAPIVDIGAYEFTFLPGDFDSDGDVDAVDLTVFAACGTGPAIAYNPATLPEPSPGCTLTPDSGAMVGADFDRDGDVDQSDYAVFQRCYSVSGQAADSGCAN